MDLIGKINRFLSSLGDFSLDESGTCLIEHESGLQFSVTVPEAAEFVTFYAPLAETPTDDAAPLLQHALSLNLFQDQTRGGSIAYDPRNNWLVFSLSMDADVLDETAFTNAMSNFVEVAGSLRSTLTEFAAETVTGAEGSATENSSIEGELPATFLRV